MASSVSAGGSAAGVAVIGDSSSCNADTYCRCSDGAGDSDA
ncbi:hypothetical protein [Onishia taeanensis]